MSDLSKLSDADLEAIASGDMSKVSGSALRLLAGEDEPKASGPKPRNPRTGLPDLRSAVAQDPQEFARDTANFTRVAAPVGAAIVTGSPLASGLGGAAGEYAAQKIEGSKTRPGAIAGAGVANAIIPGAGSLITRAGALGAQSLAGKAVETTVDEGRLPTVNEAGMSAGAGAVGASLERVIGAIARQVMGSAGRATPAQPRADAGMDDQATRMAREQIAKAREYTLQDNAGQSRKLKVDPTVPAVRDDRDLILKMVAGKTALGQVAAKENVPVFQGMARQDLGIPESGEGISIAAIKDARTKFEPPYVKIRQMQAQAKDQLAKLENEVLGPSNGLGAAEQARRAELASSPEFERMAKPLRIQAEADVDALRKARGDASNRMRRYLQSEGKDTVALEEYKAFKEAADTLETKIDDAARLSDDEGLIEALDKARAGNARSHNYEDAIGPDGILDPQALRLMQEAGVPLGGNAKLIADFAHSARQNSVQLSRIGDPNANAAGSVAAAHAVITSPQSGALAGGIPILRNLARKRLMSEANQDKMLRLTDPKTAKPGMDETMARIAAIVAANQNRKQ